MKTADRRSPWFSEVPEWGHSQAVLPSQGFDALDDKLRGDFLLRLEGVQAALTRQEPEYAQAARVGLCRQASRSCTAFCPRRSSCNRRERRPGRRRPGRPPAGRCRRRSGRPARHRSPAPRCGPGHKSCPYRASRPAPRPCRRRRSARRDGRRPIHPDIAGAGDPLREDSGAVLGTSPGSGLIG